MLTLTEKITRILYFIGAICFAALFVYGALVMSNKLGQMVFELLTNK
jgi:hypothetical protein